MLTKFLEAEGEDLDDPVAPGPPLPPVPHVQVHPSVQPSPPSPQMEPSLDGLLGLPCESQLTFDAHMRVLCSSLQWGSGRFQWQPADRTAPFGSVSAVCACHRKNDRTRCVKEVGLRARDRSHVETVLWALKDWLNRGPDYSRQRYHMLPRRLRLDDLPVPRVIESQRITDEPPTLVLTDVQLDAMPEPPAPVAPPPPSAPRQRRGPRPSQREVMVHADSDDGAASARSSDAFVPESLQSDSSSD